jgi:hypothetical protein
VVRTPAFAVFLLWSLRGEAAAVLSELMDSFSVLVCMLTGRLSLVGKPMLLDVERHQTCGVFLRKGVDRPGLLQIDSCEGEAGRGRSPAIRDGLLWMSSW